MKMTSIASALVGVLLTSSASAEYNNIPASQLDDYKTAISIALNRTNFRNCAISGPLAGTAEEFIKAADSAKIQNDGKQPILIFEISAAKYSNAGKAATTIVSSSDYKSIISLRTDEYVLSEVNIGDLKRPRIEMAYVIKATGECN